MGERNRFAGWVPVWSRRTARGGDGVLGYRMSAILPFFAIVLLNGCASTDPRVIDFTSPPAAAGKKDSPRKESFFHVATPKREGGAWRF